MQLKLMIEYEYCGKLKLFMVYDEIFSSITTGVPVVTNAVVQGVQYAMGETTSLDQAISKVASGWSSSTYEDVGAGLSLALAQLAKIETSISGQKSEVEPTSYN